MYSDSLINFTISHFATLVRSGDPDELAQFPANENAIHLGPVVQKPINANPRLKINQGVYFSTPKCCSTLIFGKNLQ